MSHLKNDADELGHLKLDLEEKKAVQHFKRTGLPVKFPVNWHKDEQQTPVTSSLKLQVIPTAKEMVPQDDELRDPLGEEALKQAPYVVHRYPNRALFLVTDRCAGYCRFCTRKRWVGQGPTPTKAELKSGIEYIAAHTEINDVILSGGDPLTFNNRRLVSLVEDLRALEHIDVIRLATRILSFDPQRVDDELLSMLKPFQPVYWMVHFNHADELTPATCDAITRIADAGFPILNQTVLLKNVNDNADILADLWQRLVRLRVKPYYLHHCDLVTGASHFRVHLDRALEIMQQIRFRVSGIAIPHFVIDIPGGLGKVPLTPEQIVDRDEQYIYLKGLRGETAKYPII